MINYKIDKKFIQVLNSNFYRLMRKVDLEYINENFKYLITNASIRNF